MSNKVKYVRVDHETAVYTSWKSRFYKQYTACYNQGEVFSPYYNQQQTILLSFV